MDRTLIEFLCVLGLMTGLAIALGRWIAHSFESPKHWAVERLSYRILGIWSDPFRPDSLLFSQRS